ncbi:anti-sigma factor [Shouchella shacheensis]|uniref:anti-sigma factor n=1 Tax=Shouchella shacheensis TaxID=1649580 RepID=UPI0007404657|nr:anti-sigma factor [Shouchella shacheensis]
MSKDNQCERLFDYFNDELSPRDQEAFENHLLDCEECQEQLAELYLLNEDISAHTADIEPPENMKERVLGAVFAEEESTNGDEGETNKVVPMTPGRKRRVWPMVAAAALLFSVGANVLFQMQMSGLQNDVAELEEQNNDLLAQIPADEPASEGSEFGAIVNAVQLNDAEENSVGQLSIVEGDEGQLQLVIQAELPELEGSNVYQVWGFEGETPYPSGSFVTNEKGQGALVFDLEEGVEFLNEAVAISIEEQPNNEAPSEDIVVPPTEL